MQYPLWEEEAVPELILGNEEEDFEILKERNYETLLDYEQLDLQKSRQQQARQKEEAEIAKINFENFIIRQQLEEEEEMENNGGVSSSGVGDFKFGREHVAQVTKNDYDSEMSDSDAPKASNSVENSAF